MDILIESLSQTKLSELSFDWINEIRHSEALSLSKVQLIKFESLNRV